jgi:hypothetical protein
VIINTRKLEYDAESSESSVKGLMQAQHKAALKELKRGVFDDKIDRYFGDNPDLEPVAPKRAATPAPELVEADAPAEATRPQEPAASAAEVSAAFEAIKEEEITAPTPMVAEATEPTEVPQPVAAAPVPEPPVVAPPKPAQPAPRPVADTTKMEPLDMPGAIPQAVPESVHAMPTAPVAKHRAPFQPTADEQSATVYRQVRSGKSERMKVPRPRAVQPATPVARARVTFSKPSGKKARIRDRMGESSAPRSRGGVVVSRPAVIVGGPARVVGGGGNASRSQRRFAREDSSDGLFGDDMLSEKSLDEVILAYLSEDGE